MPREPTPGDSPDSGDPDSPEAPDSRATPDSDDASLQAPPEFESPAFTFEGQIERLQAMVVGINRRGGTTKRIAQVLVLGGIALFAALFFLVIVVGVLS